VPFTRLQTSIRDNAANSAGVVLTAVQGLTPTADMHDWWHRV